MQCLSFASFYSQLWQILIIKFLKIFYLENVQQIVLNLMIFSSTVKTNSQVMCTLSIYKPHKPDSSLIPLYHPHYTPIILNSLMLWCHHVHKYNYRFWEGVTPGGPRFTENMCILCSGESNRWRKEKNAPTTVADDAFPSWKDKNNCSVPFIFLCILPYK